MSSCCCCHCCCCGCGCGCGNSCGCQGSDQELGGASLTEFPVYVSYPAFFAGDDAIDGANQAIFALGDTTAITGRILTRGVNGSSRRSCGCRG